MNKRNAALIQSFMADILSVPPERGIVKFQPIPEENFAINGTTMLGEIERQEKQQSGETGGAVRRVISNGRKSIPSFKKSTSKLDSDSKTGESRESKASETIVEEAPRPGSEEKEKAEATPVEGKKSITPIAPTAILSPMGVFELPAVEVDHPRPSTSHGHSASTSSNGLRMNGVSDNDLSPKDAKKPQRPRTFSAGTTSIQDQIKSQGLTATTASVTPPARLSSVPPSKRERPPSFLKVDPSKANWKSRHSKNASPQPPVDDNKPRPRDSYLDGIMGTPLQLKSFGNEPTIMEKPSKEGMLPDMASMKEKDEPTANTAKRRSTITAIPKMPEIPTASLPEASDAKSTKSLRVGKRKSFLAAFRKSTGKPGLSNLI